MDCSTPGLPVLHQLPELAQTHVHRVSDGIQSSLSPPALNFPSRHLLHSYFVLVTYEYYVHDYVNICIIVSK